MVADTRPAHVGILAIDAYFPLRHVPQEDMEAEDGVPKGKYTVGLGQESISFCGDNEDVVSMALSAMHTLVENYRVDLRAVGRLEVATETPVDRSKPVKSYLMEAFQQAGNTDVEGVDNVSGCYGGTAALFDAVNWIESRSWDGRYAMVVCTDIAVYPPGPARPSGGAGAVAMLIGPDAPLELDRRLSATHMENTHDFFKPFPSSQYPVVDGELSKACFLRALHECYHRFCDKYESANPGGGGFSLGAVHHILMHHPYNKLVQKATARLVLHDCAREQAAAVAAAASAAGAEGARDGEDAAAAGALPGGAEGGGTGALPGGAEGGGAGLVTPRRPPRPPPSPAGATPGGLQGFGAGAEGSGEGGEDGNEAKLLSPLRALRPSPPSPKVEGEGSGGGGGGSGGGSGRGGGSPLRDHRIILAPVGGRHGGGGGGDLGSVPAAPRPSPPPVVLGWQNKLRPALEAILATHGVVLPGGEVPREAEAEMAGLCRGVYQEMVEPGTLLGRQCGNMYTASLYGCLLSLVCALGGELEGRRVLLFSYGSGLASTLFLVRARAPATAAASRFTLQSIARLAMLRERLDVREPVPPAVLAAAADALGGRHAGGAFTPGEHPESSLPWRAHYLAEVTAHGERVYKRRT